MYATKDTDVGAFRVVSDDMWNGFLYGVPWLYFGHEEDFMTWDGTSDEVRWTVTDVGANTRATADALGGALLITLAAADNDTCSMQLGSESFVPQAGKRIYFEARFQVSDATQSDFLVGLSDTDTTPLNSSDGVFFRKDDDATTISACCVTGAVESSENAGVAADATNIKLGFVVHGIHSVDYYVNDVIQTTVNTNLPATEMCMTLHMQNGEAVAKTMQIDYIRCYQER